ncbi:hypothetical protein ASE93_10045 [Serratia sp. Leaf50]|nr:hypothetical protein ASE93_10045 [Serratia sp. Leaf50]
MKNTKVKILPYAIALVLGGLYSTVAGAHGYIENPKSRSFNYYASPWPADEIEAHKLPAGGLMENDTSYENAFNFPPDGKLASGGNANRTPLDNESYNWPVNSMKSGTQDFTWYIPAQHRTTYFTYYITKQDWKSKPGYGQKLTKEMFEDKPFCHKVYPYPASNDISFPKLKTVHTCTVPQRTGDQKIYSVWRIRDTAMAFYQMVDVKFDGSSGPEDEVVKPVADIRASSSDLSTSNLTLDASASSGKSLRYSWQVMSNSDKVTLSGSTSSTATLRLKNQATSNFNVQVKLTVTNGQNVSNSKTITLKASKPAEVNKPVAVVPADFTVTESSNSAGYELDGSRSKNAQSYSWKIVQGAGNFWLQEKQGGGWVKEVKLAKARALVPANKVGKAVYELTVIGKDGSKDARRVTVTVKPVADNGNDNDNGNGNDNDNGNGNGNDNGNDNGNGQAHPKFEFGKAYKGGDKVMGTDGSVYECKGWPATNWCNVAKGTAQEVHYTPGSGVNWSDAWIKI